MKVAIYCRLSREDEGRAAESESIQNQKSLLLRYALEKGYDVAGIYVDEDYSGADRNRPAFNAMIQAASQRRFDIILAKSQSRFTRDMELVEKYLHGKFIEWGVRFIAVVDHVDTGDAANKKSRQINGLVNEWYLEDLSNNVRAVLTHKRQSGQYIGSFAPYGYAKDPLDHNHLVVDPEAAAVVRRIFSLACSGQGAARIARELNEAGLPNPTLYKRQKGMAYHNANESNLPGQWSPATVHQILGNQTYAGDLVQGRHKKASYKSKKIVWLPREQWIVTPNTHEAIVDRPTFALVQSMRGARVSAAAGMVRPLAQKVRCGCCGATMCQTGNARVDAQGNRVRYLRCRARARSPGSCANSPVYLPALEALVLERIQSHAARAFDPGLLPTGEIAEALNRTAQRQREELRQLQGETARREGALRALRLDRQSGLVDEKQFEELRAAYREEAERLRRRAALLEQELARREDPAQSRLALSQRVRQAAGIETLTRELVCLLVESVTVFPKDPATQERRIKIAWYF